LNRGEWPDFFIVGVQKAGTTSLWHYLDQHPDIYMSRLKEPWYFAETSPINAAVSVPPVKDRGAYLRLFAPATREQRRGEATAGYFWGERTPHTIKATIPHARALVSLRDPVARAYSAYWHGVRVGHEKRSFRAAVEQELSSDQRSPDSDLTFHYVSGGLYVKPLERYLGVFGEDVHVLFFEELVRDPSREIRRVLEFVEVDPAKAGDIELTRENPFLLPKNSFAAQLLWSARARRLGRRLVPHQLRPRVERAFLKEMPRSPMDDDIRKRLGDFYAQERAELAELVGRPLPWPT
jgi:hypothetical protein